jgi:cytochrome c-type biogenesis protein
MNDWILAFTLGNAAILTNACLLPLYPALIAFLGGQTTDTSSKTTPWGARLLGVWVLAGILTMMVLIGLLLSLLSAGFGDVLPIILPIIYALVIVLGVLMVMGRNPLATLNVASAPALRNPYARAYAYGLFFAPMTLPCTGPIILSAFTVGTGVGDVANGLLYFFFFGLGFGWPLVLLPFLALPLQKRIVRALAGQHDIISRASGVLLIAIGLFGILTELLPQWMPAFHFDQPAQLIYWVLAVALMIMTGYMLHRQKTSEPA